jgi:hypothetical protein
MASPPTQHVSKNIVQKDKDKDEYEVTIIDNNFDRWFLTNGKPVNFYSREYYRSKNIFYVSSWNSKVTQRYRNSPFEEPINYDPSIDYGLDVDYKLFWYFKYIEDVYGRRYGFPNG